VIKAKKRVDLNHLGFLGGVLIVEKNLIRLGKIKLYVLNVGINLHIWVGGRPRLELIQKNQYF